MTSVNDAPRDWASVELQTGRHEVGVPLVYPSLHGIGLRVMEATSRWKEQNRQQTISSLDSLRTGLNFLRSDHPRVSPKI